MSKYNYINDLTGKPCFKVGIEKRELKGGAIATSDYVIVEEEDGEKHAVFPWELTDRKVNDE